MRRVTLPALACFGVVVVSTGPRRKRAKTHLSVVDQQVA